MRDLKFGTDGIRGPVDMYLTPEACLRVGLSAGEVFASRGLTRAVIGRDTRSSGIPLQSALVAGLTASGVDVELLGVIPTPGVACNLKWSQHVSESSQQFGIMISASHNAYQDNGIKFFSFDGNKVSADIEREIELRLNCSLDPVYPPSFVTDPDNIGNVHTNGMGGVRYMDLCLATSREIKLKGMKIVLDCANGACYDVAPRVFTQLGATVMTIGNQPDGKNINDGVGSTNLKALQAAVLEWQADIGIAFDGDGDRVMMVNDSGEVIDGDDILYVLSQSDMYSGVVGTKMSNLGLETSILEMGKTFYRADVGDKYVNEQLIDKGLLLGGETSGHIICRDVSTTGDGIVTAVKVLSMLDQLGTSIDKILEKYTKTPQVLINVHVTDKSIIETDTFKDRITRVERDMSGTGRVLVRASGTENVVRILTEHRSDTFARKHAEELSSFLKKMSAIA